MRQSPKRAAKIFLILSLALRPMILFSGTSQTENGAAGLQKEFEGASNNKDKEQKAPIKTVVQTTITLEDHRFELSPTLKFGDIGAVALRLGGINGDSFFGGVFFGGNRPSPLEPSFYATVAPSLEIKTKPVQITAAPTIGYSRFNSSKRLQTNDTNKRKSVSENVLAASGYLDAILTPWVLSKKLALTAGVGAGGWNLYRNFFKEVAQFFNEGNLTVAAGFKTGEDTMLRTWGQTGALIVSANVYRNYTAEGLPTNTIGFGGASGGADFNYKINPTQHMQLSGEYDYAYKQYHRGQIGCEWSIGPVAVWAALRHQQSMNPFFADIPAGISTQVQVKPVPALTLGIGGHYMPRLNLGEAIDPDYALYATATLTPHELVHLKAKKDLGRRQAQLPNQEQINELINRYAAKPVSDGFKTAFTDALVNSNDMASFSKQLKSRARDLGANNIANILSALRIMTGWQLNNNYDESPNEERVINGSDAIFKRWRRSYLMSTRDYMLKCKSSAHLAAELAINLSQRYGIAMTANTMTVLARRPENNAVGSHKIAVLWTRQTGFIMVDFGRILVTGTSDPEALMRLYNEREGVFGVVAQINDDIREGGAHIGYKINNDPAAIAALEALTYYGEEKFAPPQLGRHFNDPPSTPDITRQRALDAISRSLNDKQ